MNASEVLHQAADYLEQHGWMSTTHRPSGQPRATCAQVAISRVVMTSRELYPPAIDAFVAHLGGTSVGTIWRWNDAPERTAAEVIEALRAAALIEAAKEVDVIVVEPSRERVSK